MVALSASKPKHARAWFGRIALLVTAWMMMGRVIWGCNIPVFRYALENWPSDTFQVLVISSNPLSDEQRGLVNQFQERAASAEQPANLQLIHVDLSSQTVTDRLREELGGELPPAETLQRIDEYVRGEAKTSPKVFAFYPKQWDRIAWSAELSAESLDRLIDSPMRQEIANRLLSGDSAVWVLLECGRPADDQAAWERLETELKAAEQVVKLPERELIETDDFYRADVQIELKVKFSAIRLSREEARESAFAALLRGSEADLAEFDEPLAIPVYGRGRTYFALVGKGINGEMIRQNGQFLCGACSCQVKQDNPGVDMLMAVNWEERVTAQGSAEPPLPALTGVGALELTALPASQTGESQLAEGTDARVAEPQTQEASSPSETATSPSAPSLTATAATASVEGAAAEGSATTSRNSNASPSPSAGNPPAATANLPVAFSWRLLAVVGGGVVLAVAVLATLARGM